ncbi:MAG: hypothetical protein ACT4P3_00335 [Betaproteobacteria bacterium]
MRSAFAFIAGLTMAAPLAAQQVDQLQLINQAEFRLLSEDLGGALAYRPRTPTAPLGVTGFDIGVGLTAARIRNAGILERVTSDSASETIPVPSLRIHKGLPLGFDVGLIYAAVPGSNLEYIGGELRYALVLGGVAAPALGVRGNLTKLRGVEQLEVDTRGLDISISKGFAVLTPYAGIGRVWVESQPKGVPNLVKEEFELNQLFLGVGFKLALFNINLEADKTGDVEGFSVKAGLRF